MPVPDCRGVIGPRLLAEDVVFARIVTAIIDGTLEPGDVLRDAPLMAWLGYNRTSIRAALRRLQAAGLVEIDYPRYTRVSVMDRDQLVQFAQQVQAAEARAV